MTAWADALICALTGSVAESPAAARPGDGRPAALAPEEDKAEILRTLAALGWTRHRLIAHAQSTWARHEPWPHPVPGAAARFGAARWQAALDSIRHRLGLDAAPRPPSRRTALTADERRLLADKPPHYG